MIILVYASAGAGHRKAAEAIYDYYRRSGRTADIRLIDVLDRTNFLVANLYAHGYLFLINHAIWLWRFIFWLTSVRTLGAVINRLNSLFNRINTLEFNRYLIKEQPEIIISTHFLSSEIAAYLKRTRKIKSQVITVITDFGVHPFWLSEGTDLYIAATSYTKETLINNGIEERRIRVYGIPVDYRFTRQYSQREARGKLGIGENRFTVLITTGSFGIGPVEKIVNALHKDVQLIVVCAKNKALYRRLNRRGYSDVKVFGFIDNIEEAMAASDIAIIKPGGLTISEILCMELIPLFICPIPGQETENIKILERYGIGRRIKNISGIREIVLGYKNNPQLIAEAKENIGRLRKNRNFLEFK